MIEIKCKQGSPEWFEARIGVPTASQFHRIITPKTMKPSGQASGYLAELCAEWALNESLDEGMSLFMERGIVLEPEALRYYEFDRNITTRAVGVCFNNDRTLACSPDRLVGEHGGGGVEIKSPGPKAHVSRLLEGLKDEHRCQVQGCLFVTGRSWWDVMSYHPFLPPVLVRVDRDEAFLKALAEALGDFLLCLAEAKERLTELGASPAEVEAKEGVAALGPEPPEPPDDDTAIAAAGGTKPRSMGGPKLEDDDEKAEHRYVELVELVSDKLDRPIGDAQRALSSWMRSQGLNKKSLADDAMYKLVLHRAGKRDWGTP